MRIVSGIEQIGSMMIHNIYYKIITNLGLTILYSSNNKLTLTALYLNFHFRLNLFESFDLKAEQLRQESRQLDRVFLDVLQVAKTKKLWRTMAQV
jgi:hypothetical protein